MIVRVRTHSSKLTIPIAPMADPLAERHVDLPVLCDEPGSGSVSCDWLGLDQCFEIGACAKSSSSDARPDLPGCWVRMSRNGCQTLRRTTPTPALVSRFGMNSTASRSRSFWSSVKQSYSTSR
jgi:hypothetical protein